MGPIHQRKVCTCKVALVKLIFVGSDLINIFQRKYKIYVTMISKHSDWLEKIEQPIGVLKNDRSINLYQTVLFDHANSNF